MLARPWNFVATPMSAITIRKPVTIDDDPANYNKLTRYSCVILNTRLCYLRMQVVDLFKYVVLGDKSKLSLPNPQGLCGNDKTGLQNIFEKTSGSAIPAALKSTWFAAAGRRVELAANRAIMLDCFHYESSVDILSSLAYCSSYLTFAHIVIVIE